MTKYTTRILTVILSLVLLASTCWFVYQHTGTSRGSLVIALDSRPITVDPAAMTDIASANVGNAIHAPMIRIARSGAIESVLADSITMSDDGLAATIRLRPDAKFSDGTPVQSSDVRFSLLRLRQSTSAFKWICDRIDRVETRSDHELVIHFSRPDPEFPSLVANLQASIIKSNEDKLARRPLDLQLIGAGSFMPLRNDDGGTTIELLPTAATNLDRLPKHLAFKVVPDLQSQLEELRRGRIDVLRLRGPALEEALTRRHDGSVALKDIFGGLKLVTGRASELTFLSFNWQSPQLKEVQTVQRRAVLSGLSAKIDRQAIARDLYLGFAESALGVVPPSAFDGSQEGFSEGSMDLPQSRLELIAPNDPSSRQLARYLQDRFATRGIDLQCQFLDLPRFIEMLVTKKYEVALVWFEMPVAGAGAWTMFFEEENPFSAFAEAIPSIREQVQAARGTRDPVMRRAAYAEVISRINSHQTTWIPIVSRWTVLACSRDVEDPMIDLTGTAVWTTLRMNK